MPVRCIIKSSREAVSASNIWNVKLTRRYLPSQLDTESKTERRRVAVSANMRWVGKQRRIEWRRTCKEDIVRFGAFRINIVVHHIKKPPTSRSINSANVLTAIFEHATISFESTEPNISKSSPFSNTKPVSWSKIFRKDTANDFNEENDPDEKSPATSKSSTSMPRLKHSSAAVYSSCLTWSGISRENAFSGCRVIPEFQFSLLG